MKNLTRSYLVALAIIALVISLSQYLVQNSIKNSSTDSRIINISGRQRMLSQKISKAALAMANSREQEEFEVNKKELNGAFTLLRNSNRALQYGSAEMEMETVNNSERILELFIELKPYYAAMESGVLTVLSSDSLDNINSKEFRKGVREILNNEAGFLKLMNDITFQYDAEALERVKTLSVTEYGLYFIALLLLLLEGIVIFRPAIKRISDYTFKLNESLKQQQFLTDQAESIFENVTQGIFMLDEKLTIDQFYSKQTETIFEDQHLGGVNFLSLMKSRLLPNDLIALELFVENLFNSDIRQDVANKLNPVEQVEIYTNKEGSLIETRYIKISFSRIIRDKSIYRVLVTVLDETENVLMKKQVEDAELRSKKESAQLLSILKVDPQTLKEFIESTVKELKTISPKYEAHEDSSFTDLIGYTFNILHKAKGNASLINLELIEDKLHETEDELIKLRKKIDINGKDFLKIVYQVTEIISMLTEMKQMLMKITLVYQQMTVGSPSISPNEGIISVLRKGVEKLGNVTKKETEFIFKDNGVVIPDEYKIPIKDLSIQLIRNSFIHGLEATDVRKFSGKNQKSTLLLEINKLSGLLQVSYEDDGKGVDLQAITEKALQNHLITPSELEKMSETDVLNLIFKEGLSTIENADKNAGRGQGMSVIYDIVNNLGGTCHLESEKDKFFRIVINLPAKSTKQLKSTSPDFNRIEL